MTLPQELAVEDIEDFCSLAQYYSSRTPQSFRKVMGMCSGLFYVHSYLEGTYLHVYMLVNGCTGYRRNPDCTYSAYANVEYVCTYVHTR